MSKQVVRRGERVYCPYCRDSYDVDDYVDDNDFVDGSGGFKLTCATCGREFKFEVATSVEETTSKKGISLTEAVSLLVEIYENHPEGLYPHSSDRIKVREIGQALYDLGGMNDMLAAHREFAMRSPRHARNLEMVWNGIGEWMG